MAAIAVFWPFGHCPVDRLHNRLGAGSSGDVECRGLPRSTPSPSSRVIDELSLDDHADAAAPLSVIVLQEVRNDDYQALLNGLGAEWSAATYTNQSEDGYGGAQACFYRADQLLEIPAGHDDLYTGAGRRCDRWQFTLVGH